MARRRFPDRLPRLSIALVAVGLGALLAQLVWNVYRATQLVPPSGFILTEGQLETTREVLAWEAVRRSLWGLIAFTIIVGVLALLGSKRLRTGARTWWTDLGRVRSTVDVLAKTAAVVGVFAVLDIFTLAPKLQATYACQTLFDPEALRDAYGGETPQVQAAILFGGSIHVDDLKSYLKSSPEELIACASDNDVERFRDSLIEHLPEPADTEVVRTQIEESTYQWASLSVVNLGRGSALDVTLAMPVPFELTGGPQGVFDLQEGEGVSWTMETPGGETGHNPTVQIGLKSAHDPDLTFYIFALMVTWGLLVVPALAAGFWRIGPGDPAK